MSAPAESKSASHSASPRKSLFSLFIATAGGLGYIPFAPGTFGSLAGLVLAMIPSWALFVASIESDMHFNSTKIDPILFAQIVLAVAVAVAGVWSATRAAQFWRE